MTPADLFRRAGAALYGEQFVAPLAVALGVEKNTVGKWAAGKSPVPLGVWKDLHRLIEANREAVCAVDIELGREVMRLEFGEVPAKEKSPPPG